MNDERRNLARSARTVQNLQLMMLAGMILGAVGGFLLGAFVLMPMLGDTPGFLGTIVSVVVGGFVGQRAALNL